MREDLQEIEMRDECEHGSLRRQCPWCLMDQEIKDRDQKIEALLRQEKSMKEEQDRQRRRAEHAEKLLRDCEDLGGALYQVLAVLLGDTGRFLNEEADPVLDAAAYISDPENADVKPRAKDLLPFRPKPRVPDGWVLVPKEPTDKMKRACDETYGPMTAWKAWQVMTDAAPEPPKEGEA